MIAHLGSVDLAGAGLAPELPGQLAHLGDGLGRDSFREAPRPPLGFHGKATADGGVAVSQQALGLADRAEPSCSYQSSSMAEDRSYTSATSTSSGPSPASA